MRTLGLKGVSIAIFTFVGAIVMTFVSIWILTLDSSWHLGQRLTQAASYVSIADVSSMWPPLNLFQAVAITLGVNMLEVEHALFGQSPSSYFLWFIGYLFMFMIIGGLIGLITDKTDLDPLKVLGFGAFIVGGAIASTYIAIFVVVIDAQWHLRSVGTVYALIGQALTDAGQPFVFADLLGLVVVGNWEFFEHSVGQSASSYVLWFILFIVIYPIITGILVWIARRR